MNPLLKFLSVTSICLIFLPAAFAQQAVRLEPMLGSMSPLTDYGTRLAVQGDFVFVGTRTANIGTDSRVFVYQRDGTGNAWQLQDILTDGNNSGTDGFGSDFQVDGDQLLIGDPQKVDFNGQLFVYQQQGSEWVKMDSLLASDSGRRAQFGSTVDIDGDHAVVGSIADFQAGFSNGSVYFLRREEGQWIETFMDLPDVPISISGTRLGWEVAIEDDFAFVGTFPQPLAPAAELYMYKRNGNAWTEVERLEASERTSDDQFGTAISMDGNYAAIGAPAGTSVFDEKTYVFRREGDNWIEETILRHNLGDGVVTDFGTSVALKGDFLAVGSPEESLDAAVGTGAVYLYQRDGQQWNLVNKIYANNPIGNLGFGSLVALSENTLVVTARNEINSDGIIGVVYVFSLQEVISTSTDRPFIDSPLLDVQTFPSPFNSQLKVSYDIPGTGHVTIEAYDVLGRKVATLEDAFKAAGTYQLTWAPEKEVLPVGMYFLRVQAKGTSMVVPVIRQ